MIRGALRHIDRRGRVRCGGEWRQRERKGRWRISAGRRLLVATAVAAEQLHDSGLNVVNCMLDDVRGSVEDFVSCVQNRVASILHSGIHDLLDWDCGVNHHVDHVRHGGNRIAHYEVSAHAPACAITEDSPMSPAPTISETEPDDTRPDTSDIS